MKLNKVLNIILLLSIIFSVIPYSYAGSTYNSNIDVTLVNYEPDPLNPGRVAEIKFQIENNGKDVDEDVYIEIVPEYPFSLYSGEKKIFLGKLRSYQTGSDAYIVKYKMKVDNNAVGGVYDIKVRLWKGNSLTLYEDNFQVTVESTGKDLGVDYYFKPTIITPGNQAELFIKLNNGGVDNYENIYLNLNVSDDFMVLESTEEKFVETINNGEEKLISYKFTLSPDFNSPYYLIPLTLEYEDDSGNLFTKDLKLTATVDNYAELMSYISDSDNFIAGSTGEVTISLANIGIAKVKALNIEIIDTEEYDVLSPKKDYIGDVDADDVESEDFKLYINPEAKEKITLKLKINYRDEKNKVSSDEIEVPLKIYEPSELKKYGLVSNGTSTYIIIAIIVLAGIGYFFYRRMKNKKKKNK